MTLSFDGKVVAITGAGNGVGRAHALEFARRGAKIVVNDLGGAPDGSGADNSAASKVVNEITSLGGEAVANFASVATQDGGASVTQSALDAFGRIDVMVANAGILRDKSFLKTDVESLDAVLNVHLRGTFFTVQPAFAWMKENGGGRIVVTTSASGLFGNFGQANYAMAKLGIVGLMRVMSIEGAKNNIFTNAIAPMAATRLTMGEDKEDDPMAPSKVSPLVAALCHESSTVNGETFLAGWGIYARTWVAQGDGWRHGDKVVTAEDVVAHMDKIRDNSHFTEIANSLESGAWAMNLPITD